MAMEGPGRNHEQKDEGEPISVKQEWPRPSAVRGERLGKVPDPDPH